MNTLNAMAEVLKREGTEYLFCFPTLDLIEVAAQHGIRPIVCRQERVGMGMADAYSRITNGKKIGVFAMQAGPGAENAYPGITTSYADASPVLVLPSGYERDREGWPHIFTAARGYSNVTKWLEQINVPEQITDAMRRGYSRLKNGRLGPVIIEVPGDVAIAEVGEINYVPATAARSAADPADVERAALALLGAQRPVIHAGQGILYAEATDELVELAELLSAPVYSTLLGKSAFPESHPLALGIAAGSASWPAIHFMRESDLIFGAGASMAKHQMSANLPFGKTLVQVTNDESDLNRNYAIDFPMLGDAKLVLRQLIDAINDLGGTAKRSNAEVTGEITKVRDEWMAHWLPKLTSKDAPINPYRVVWELQKAIPAADAIVTHDSGSPRDQMVPFYRSAGPRSYIGWGKSHALGTGLGFAMGAKLAAPNKVCINWMGDAAFGMTGLDFETAVRCQIPIITIVSNNYTMAIETSRMLESQERFRTRDLGGNYADLAHSLGGRAERVENPEEIGPALIRARRITEEEGLPVLVEIMTSAETERSTQAGNVG
jgi:thiamine pyrophosphate-dependent acetolactate synthase large subunit-like protein